MSDELPEGWAIAPLGDLTRPTRPRRIPQKYPRLQYVGMEQVESHTRRLLGRLPTNQLKSAAFHFQPGDVLYGRLRPYLNKVLCAEFEGLCSSEFIVLPPGDVLEPKYLAFYLSAESFVAFANRLNQGDRPRVSFDQIASHEVSVPPLPEQRRIVARLEELLGKADVCRERLERVPELLKRFRQSVLSAACSGRLTEDWRAANPEIEDAERLGEGEPPSEVELPSKWDWLLSSHEFGFVTSGSRGWARYYSDRGALFLRVGNLNHDGIELDLRSIQRVSTPPSAEGRRTRVASGDILVSITADVGMVGVVRGNIGEAYINQHVALARPLGNVEPRFLAYFLAARNGGQEQFQNLQRGATKVGLGLDDIRRIWIARPPRREQVEIVRRIELLFAIADGIEARCVKARTHVAQLSPCLLAQAFRGELVPIEAELARREGRSFEPAAVLVERVHAERLRSGKDADKEAASRQRPTGRAASATHGTRKVAKA